MSLSRETGVCVVPKQTETGWSQQHGGQPGLWGSGPGLLRGGDGGGGASGRCFPNLTPALGWEGWEVPGLCS